MALADCVLRSRDALDAYRFDEAAGRISQFVWGTFCDWYIEFTKPILQGEDPSARAETQAMTAWVLGQIVAAAASGHAVHHQGCGNISPARARAC